MSLIGHSIVPMITPTVLIAKAAGNVHIVCLDFERYSLSCPPFLLLMAPSVRHSLVRVQSLCHIPSD